MAAEQWTAIRTRIRQLRKSSTEGSDQYRRMSRLIGKISQHINWYGDRQVPQYDHSALFSLGVFNSALKSGKKIVVFDSEWPYQEHPFRKINELGLVIIEGGEVVTHNVQVGNYYKSGKFSHGNTVAISDLGAKKWLTDQINGSECVVGHSLESDRNQLRKWGWYFPQATRFVDTSLLGEALYGSRLKLSILARRMGVLQGNEKLHCAGNDAYLTWLVVRQIAENANIHRENEYATTLI